MQSRTCTLTPIESALLDAMIAIGLRPERQHPVGIFYCDFAFPEYHLVIECDGHDYHSTKEQRAADARRDRKLFRMGWWVLRFTGSQIHADAEICALEIRRSLEVINDWHEKIAQRSWVPAALDTI